MLKGCQSGISLILVQDMSEHENKKKKMFFLKFMVEAQNAIWHRD